MAVFPNLGRQRTPSAKWFYFQKRKRMLSDGAETDKLRKNSPPEKLLGLKRTMHFSRLSLLGLTPQMRHSKGIRSFMVFVYEDSEKVVKLYFSAALSEVHCRAG